MYVKHAFNSSLILKLREHILEMLSQVKPVTSFPPVIQYFKPEHVEPFKELDKVGEFAVEFMLVAIELVAIQERTNYLSTDTENYKSSKSFESSISFWLQGDVNQCFPQLISAKIKEAVHYFASRLLPKDRWNKVSVFAPEVDYGGLSFPVNSDF